MGVYNVYMLTKSECAQKRWEKVSKKERSVIMSKIAHAQVDKLTTKELHARAMKLVKARRIKKLSTPKLAQ